MLGSNLSGHIYSAQKVMLSAHHTMEKPESNWEKKAPIDQLSWGSKSPYTRYLNVKRLQIVSYFPLILTKPMSNIQLFKVFLITNARYLWLLLPWIIQSWLSDTATSKVIAQFRACNLRLGNRGPARNGQFYKLCPLCAQTGVAALNNEVGSSCNMFND